MFRRQLRYIALLLALLIPTAIVSAAETVTLGNFQIDLVSHQSLQNGTDVFTYAVTGIADTQALSHWTLGIDTCVDHLVKPLPGSYTTETNIPSCTDNTYLCQEAQYTVVTGNDATLGINGIKFEDGVPQLTEGNTHVFEIAVEELAYVEPMAVGVKYGQTDLTGSIDGPVCGEGSAVSLASTSVSNAQLLTMLPWLVVALLVMAGATVFVLRREVAPVRVK